MVSLTAMNADLSILKTRGASPRPTDWQAPIKSAGQLAKETFMSPTPSKISNKSLGGIRDGADDPAYARRAPAMWSRHRSSEQLGQGPRGTRLQAEGLNMNN